MPSKRFFKTGFVVVLLAVAAVVIRVAIEPVIGWQVFEERISSVFTTSRLNLNVLGVVTQETKEVPLPFFRKLRSALSWQRHPQAITGSPDSVSAWTLKQIGGPVLQCLARYHEGKVACVVIRSVRAADQQMRTLRDEIAEAFPHLTITLEEICPPVGSGARF